ncbi:tRNA (guanine(37)-N1)-methyltransferase [Aedes aegypti]|uniref:tRNA (guanine(37)-N1)-methyltransferase n=1 Tax=Aedes aegypti TaxID=7159 RepID=A0A6I8THQ4_AEDAE|nr:tRNA (guanine(37)-N1)-methyltransferase [Aedes aegypti]
MLFRRFLNLTTKTPHLQTFRARHYFRNMSCPELIPPPTVRGMTVLDKGAFDKRISAPRLIVPRQLNFQQICSSVKKLLLKMECFKPVVSGEYKITLHPSAVKTWEDLKEIGLEDKGLTEENLVWEEMKLGYDNWRYDEILKAVLPEDKEALSAFSKVGHIVHLNLKEHLLPYKNLIGTVIKDKVVGCRAVVNKLVTIDNTYRNFQMELLCGEEDYQVSLKENGCIFEFDFSKVYWNSRLSTEHGRVVEMLKKGDVLLDVYAGVGPFSIPAAKKGYSVLANDLNPDSYKALVHNCAKNKVQGRITCFNKNGIDFIKEEIKQFIISKNQDDTFTGTIHITMNLPALAVEHLENYVGLLKDEQIELKHFPLVHVYCFAKGVEDNKLLARGLVEKNMGIPLGNNLKEIAFVRNVAPNKDMMRVSFYLTRQILCHNDIQLKRPTSETSHQDAKRKCNIATMGKRNIKNRNQQKQTAKKVKNVFAVNQSKKGNVKKAKEVTSKLKKINVQDKREKADKKFQDLHAHIVAKKPEKKPLPAKPASKKNKNQANTKQVEAGLDKMQM